MRFSRRRSRRSQAGEREKCSLPRRVLSVRTPRKFAESMTRADSANLRGHCSPVNPGSRANRARGIGLYVCSSAARIDIGRDCTRDVATAKRVTRATRQREKRRTRCSPLAAAPSFLIETIAIIDPAKRNRRNETFYRAPRAFKSATCPTRTCATSETLRGNANVDVLLIVPHFLPSILADSSVERDGALVHTRSGSLFHQSPRL